MAKANKIIPIKASDFDQAPKMNVLGTFSGECADATITNNNGLDITRPVWETVIASDEYKQAVKLGWYIGFLGHPEDPNCMDFRNACIVMRDMRIDESGKIYGNFDLIDTPVGRVVKAFIDAGVTFGISVRGAGDIVSNSVDPETFVFRGFDLVTFPAYPDAIPVFTQIAASSDVESQKKYKRVQAAIQANVKSISSASALETIQSQLAAQSDEYKCVENQKDALKHPHDLTDDRVEAVTHLYLQQVEATDAVKKDLERVNRVNNQKYARVKAIMSSQFATLRQENAELQSQLQQTRRNYRTTVSANSKLKEEIMSLTSANLKYKQEVIASRKILQTKDSELQSAKHQQGETVAQLKQAQTKTSNLDARVSSLQTRIEATTALLAEYQTAYAELYATAVGKSKNVKITSTTSVSDLQMSINGSSETDSIVDVPVYDVELADPNSIVTL